jgi:bifunctional DNA-binding transcriptional regulator/antitoxin component of YhaV-PrlF toxin-antitoxin module
MQETYKTRIRKRFYIGIPTVVREILELREQDVIEVTIKINP